MSVADDMEFGELGMVFDDYNVKIDDAKIGDAKIIADLIIVCMLALFNTATGVCAWIPAVYGETKVVIVSVVLLNWFFESRCFTVNGREYTVSAEAIKFFFETFEKVKMDWTTAKCRDFLLQTPFRAGQENNRSNLFFVTSVEDWMERLQTATMELDVSVNIMVPKEFGHYLSFQNCRVPTLNNYRIPDEVKLIMPAMGVPWWGNLFSDVVLECFGVSANTGGFHIVNSKVVEGVQHEFSATKDRVREVVKQKKREAT